MDFESLDGLDVYPRSITEHEDKTYFLLRDEEGEKYLGVVGEHEGFEGRLHRESGALLCSLTPENAAALRARLPWLSPAPLGLALTVGVGDRLGLATPGHARAIQSTGVAAVFAQQSVRENQRTGRSPAQVLDDAMWGAFQEGWRQPWGADADHLKSYDDADMFIPLEYSFYTVDPGAHVDNEAHTAPVEVLEEKLQALPWDELEDSPDALRARYLDQTFAVESYNLTFDEESLLRAATKYGRAILHTADMYRYLVEQMGDRPFEFEVSVDETDTPTSPQEHFFIASELKRLGVEWVSLAPRYVGRFEKGTDYIGDLETFEEDFARHAAIARVLGPYKLSLHSGSDKFSIYPIATRRAGRLIHLKTSGTSYVEALRVIAHIDPDLFREILAFARERYPEDRKGYHVSAEVERVPAPDELEDEELPGVLDTFDGREVLHVTYGSVFDRFGNRLHAPLKENEEAYYETLVAHFERHLCPFIEAEEREG